MAWSYLKCCDVTWKLLWWVYHSRSYCVCDGIRLLLLKKSTLFMLLTERNRHPAANWRQTCRAHRQPYDLHLTAACRFSRSYDTPPPLREHTIEIDHGQIKAVKFQDGIITREERSTIYWTLRIELPNTLFKWWTTSSPSITWSCAPDLVAEVSVDRLWEDDQGDSALWNLRRTMQFQSKFTIRPSSCSC